MKINLEIIINVVIAMVIWKMFVQTLASILIKYMLDNSTTVQKQKQSFKEKLAEKLKEREGVK